jgi:hypothetical protein
MTNIVLKEHERMDDMSDNVSWAPEVHAEGEWVGNSLRFATQAEAEAYGDELLSRWYLPDESRAVPSPDPVNYKWESGRAVRLEAQ